MPQSGFSTIQIYSSTTASSVPLAANLSNGELAINIYDGKMFYKDNLGVVRVLATKATGTIGGATTQVQYNSGGVLAGATNLAVNTSTGVVYITSPVMINPTVTNYTEGTYGATGNTSIDLSLGTIWKITTNGNNTVTLPASVAGKSFVVILAYTGAHTVTWAGGSTIKWSRGTTPAQTSVNEKFDIYTFFQDGVNTYGAVFGQNY